MTLRIGVDLGGTKIEAIALTAAGEVRARQRIATPTGDYTATVRAVVDLVTAVEKAAGGAGTVGVGIPGAVSPATGRVKNANSTWLIGRALDADLETALGRPVRLANDADCFALSEATDGAAAGAPVVFGVILGTGVGGGIVVNGRPISGPNAIAGEWGHNPLPAPTDDERPGPSCYCGRSGCVETWLSGPALAADHARVTGATLTAEAIAGRAAAGDAACIATLERHAARLAKALAGVINILDPHVIVLGGGLSNMAHLYDRVPALWGAHVFSDRVDTRLVPPVHGDSSGVRGAAWLWPA
ncbi:ROK family Glucokinase with ambiguous substrate specificity [Caenispirillum salinarum AK4]|uniref:ROK family Glucokinase with ambiguous substrate specificity n=1 Tax=Caenispirillum salinarum AK4 TaxID=1238182 RepID=K9HGN5_9PROT|nr:ROK family protein [Caenispirillum salinarum]EKV29603.1 ROK family Glucokinase with ambiguous substrate specificity [Caenispirillum salinarum AK4]